MGFLQFIFNRYIFSVHLAV